MQPRKSSTKGLLCSHIIASEQINKLAAVVVMSYIFRLPRICYKCHNITVALLDKKSKSLGDSIRLTPKICWKLFYEPEKYLLRFCRIKISSLSDQAVTKTLSWNLTFSAGKCFFDTFSPKQPLSESNFLNLLSSIQASGFVSTFPSGRLSLFRYYWRTHPTDITGKNLIEEKPELTWQFAFSRSPNNDHWLLEALLLLKSPKIVILNDFQTSFCMTQIYN